MLFQQGKFNDCTRRLNQVICVRLLGGDVGHRIFHMAIRVVADTKGHKWWVGILTSIAVMAVFIVPIAKVDIQEKQENAVKEEKYLAAKAVFDARCKDAGYKIYRTVDNVEGVTLLNVWPREKRKTDQMWEYAGLPDAYGEDSYIQGFLLWRAWDYKINDFSLGVQGFARNKPNIPPKADEINRYKYFNGFQYVDVLQNQTYQRYQFKDLYYLDEIATTAIKKPSRYTVEFENPILPKERKIWIATTKAFVKDSKTGELLGEAAWHSFHGPQGEIKYSGTGVWDRAKVCPYIADDQNNPIQYFVLKVLKPKQLNQENNDGKLKN